MALQDMEVRGNSDITRYAARTDNTELLELLAARLDLRHRRDAVEAALVCDSVGAIRWFFAVFGREPLLQVRPEAVDQAADEGSFAVLVTLHFLGAWPGCSTVPLTAACVFGRVDVVEWLLEAGIHGGCEPHAPLWAMLHRFPRELQVRVSAEVVSSL